MRSRVTRSSSKKFADMSTKSDIISVPLQKFTLFPKLPPELRRRIWRASLPGPRLVAIIYGDDRTCSSSAIIPRALHTSTESRFEASRFYKLSFASTIGVQPGTAKVWFDNSIDFFYLKHNKPAREVDTEYEYLHRFTELRFEMLGTTSDLEGLQYIGLGAVEVLHLYHWAAKDSPKRFPIKAFQNGAKIYGILRDGKFGELGLVSSMG